MQSRFLLEGYLKTANWLEANEWLQEECCLLHAKLKRKRIVYNIFGILMALVTAFFNWVILFGMGDEEELIAFPLTTLCHNLFLLLCEKIPGGKAVVIIGLLLLPFVVALFTARTIIRPSRATIIYLVMRSRPPCMLKLRIM